MAYGVAILSDVSFNLIVLRVSVVHAGLPSRREGT